MSNCVGRTSKKTQVSAHERTKAACARAETNAVVKQIYSQKRNFAQVTL